MHSLIVDCKGLPCPQPVIRIRQALQTASPESVLVLVDNDPARENACRFLASRGYAVAYAADAGIWRITATRGEGVAPVPPHSIAAPRPSAASGEEARTLIVLLAPVLGVGDETLGGKLMKNFLATLPEMGESLWRIVMLNGGVQLAVHGSPVLEELLALERSGVSILVCGTCLAHFGLLHNKAVGETTNMLDIVTSMHVAEKIIRM